MPIREANFEGQIAGTTIGVANSSAFGDDPFTNATATTMTLTYGTVAAHGTGGAAFSAATAAGAFAVLGYGGFSTPTASLRFGLWLEALPANEFQFAQFRSTTGGLIGLNLSPTGAIKALGPASALLYTSTATLSISRWYRIELSSIISATAGQVRFAGYLGDATTAVTGLSFDTGTAYNSGTVPIVEGRIGKITSSALTGAFDVDDFAVNDGSAASIGPYLNTAPTPHGTVTTGSAVVDCTGSTPGTVGDTLTYTISPTLGTTQPARGIFVVDQQITDVSYVITVNESNGQSKTISLIVPSDVAVTSSSTLPKVFHNGVWQ